MAKRLSPQGWQDSLDGWPNSRGFHSTQFASPWDAVSSLENTFSMLLTLDESIQGNVPNAEKLIQQMSLLVEEYARCLAALYVLDTDMAKLEGTYGRLSRALEKHLSRLPHLVLNPVVSRYLSYLPDDFEDSGSNRLAREAIVLQGAITQAQKSLKDEPRTLPDDGIMNSAELIDFFIGLPKNFINQSFGDLKEVFARRDLSTTKLLRSIGDASLDMGRYGDAKTVFLESLEILKDFQNEKKEDISILYNQIGLAHRSLAEYEQAEECYRKSLVIAKEIYDIEHENIATIHNNIGVLCRKNGRLDEAKEHYEIACKIRKKLLGATHPEFAASLMNLGALCFETNDLDEALVYYLRSLDIWKGTLKEEDQRIGGLLGNLGDLYFKRKELEQAEYYYRNAIEQLEKGVGSSHPLLAAPLLGLASLLKKTGRQEEARPLEVRGYSLLPSS